jgi:hypothetical protein
VDSNILRNTSEKVTPNTLAGDPFAHAGGDRHHGCYDGWMYLGFETEEDGELVEITDRVPCRRCSAAGDVR